MAYRKDTQQPNYGGQGFARTAKAFGRTVNISVADQAAPFSNTVGAFTVPAGFTVTGVISVAGTLTGIAFTIGDAGLANRYMSGGVTGTTITTLNATGLLYKNLTETEILITISAGGGPAGTIQLYLTGFIDN